MIAGAVVACGDDDDGGSTGGTDAGKADTGSAAAAPFDGSVQASAAAVTVYYGATVKLDATPSTAPTGSTFTWSITSVPPGSGITTASLTDPTTATPGFQPDQAGVYSLALALAGGGSTSTIPVTVTVVDPPVFFAKAADDGGTYTATFNVVGAGFGDGGAPVSCFARDAGGSYAMQELPQIGQMDSDWWEAPAGQPSKLVYAIETREDGGAHTSLLASTSSSTCATAPVTLDEVGTGNSYATRAIEEPSLSPSGARVAYLRTLPTGTTVATVGFDGSGRRDLAPFYAYADGGASPDASTQGPSNNNTPSYVTRPTWLDESTLAWAQITGSTWQIVSSTDVAGAATTLVMTCTGTQPHQIAKLPSGEILVTETPTNTTSSAHLTAYTITPGTKACATPRDISKISASNAVFAKDFALSPDRSMIAFVTVPDAGVATQIRVVNVDGTLVSATGIGNGVGPRWVGGGAFLAWSGAEATFNDAGASANATVMAVSQVDGGGLHQVTTPATDSATFYAIGNGFCAMGRGYGSGVTFFGILGVAGLRLARRRKNAKV